MLGKVVVHDQHVSALVHEILCYGASCIRRYILQRCNIGCCCRYDDSVLHGSLVLKVLHQLCHCGVLLAYGNVYAYHVLTLLIEDRIYGDGSLTCLSVADDQFSLSSADRDHGVDGLDTCLQRLVYRSSLQNSRRRVFNRPRFRGLYSALAVYRLSQGIDYTPQYIFTYRNFNYFACRSYYIAFFYLPVGAHYYAAHIVFFKIHRHPVCFSREFEKLARHAVVETVDSGDAVSYLYNSSEIGDLCLVLIILYLFFYDCAYFFRS